LHARARETREANDAARRCGDSSSFAP
jgi:hypothetical protein